MDSVESGIDNPRVNDSPGLQEAIEFSLAGFARIDQRKERRNVRAETRRQWYAAADGEQVIERIYEKYGQLSDTLNQFVAGLSEEQVTSWLPTTKIGVGEEGGLDFTEGIFTDFLFGDDPEEPIIADYQDEAECALDRLLALGAEGNDMSQAVALITTLKDPVLAHRFLGAMDRRPQYGAALTSIGSKKHLHQSRRELLADKTGIMKAFMIGLKVIRSGRSVDKITKQDVYEPLREITGYPKVSYQILNRALHGQQLDQPV